MQKVLEITTREYARNLSLYRNKLRSQQITRLEVINPDGTKLIITLESKPKTAKAAAEAFRNFKRLVHIERQPELWKEFERHA